MKSILFFLFGGILLVTACSEDSINEQGASTVTGPGTYIVGINLNTELPLTKGVAYEGGNFSFTNEYAFDYIYLHQGDQSIKIPVNEVADCGEGCKGFRYKICVDEEGGATITPLNTDGTEIEGSTSVPLSAGENAYFSSWPEDEWEAELSSNKVPHNESAELYIRDEDKNVELFRSSKDFSIADLVEGGQIDLTRTCSGFSFFCAFTDRSDNELSKEDFFEAMGDNPEKYTIKIYVGAAFTRTYNLKEKIGDEKETEGYYASGDAFDEGDYGNMNAVPLRENIQSEENGTGYGYSTLENNYLIAPINQGRPLTVYIYVTHKSSDGSEQTIYTSVSTPLNAVENYFMRMGADIDIRELAAAFEQYENLPETVSTRSLSGPYRFEAKTLKTYISY